MMCSGNTNMELYKFTKTGPFSMQFSLCHTLHYFLPVSFIRLILPVSCIVNLLSCFLNSLAFFLFPVKSTFVPFSEQSTLLVFLYIVPSVFLYSVPSVFLYSVPFVLLYSVPSVLFFEQSIPFFLFP